MFEDVIILNKDIHIVNKVPQEDIDLIVNVMFDEKAKENIESLGAGMYGKVYKIVGKDGFEYAVKQSRLARIESQDDSDLTKPHDANFLESLQGNDGYPTLFFYVEGLYQEGTRKFRYMLMVMNRVKGYTFSAIQKEVSKKKEFASNMSNAIIDKLKNSLLFALNKGIMPSDLHLGNVMFDLEKGIAVIVDIGCFCEQHNNDTEFLVNGMRIYEPEKHYESNRCLTNVNELIESSKQYIKVGA